MRRAFDLELSTEDFDPVTHVLHPGAGADSGRIGAAAVIAHRKHQLTTTLFESNGRLGRLGVLDDVL